MKWLAVILTVLVIGCGDTGPRVVDPLLEAEVASFEAACECTIPSSVIVIDARIGTAGGDATAYFDGDHDAIVFSRPALDGYAARIGAQEYGLEPIVFHEFGHYVLGQVAHRNDMIDGRAASLMNANPLNFIYVYPEHRVEYLIELFGRNN